MSNLESEKSQFGIAVDIGTSTVKAYLVENLFESSLVNSPKIKIHKEMQEKNSQYLYGKDVISRVMYAHYNGLTKLRETIVFQITSLIKRLLQTSIENLPQTSLENFSIVITGNSVMLSILEDLSLETFEKFPFKSPSNFGYYITIPEISSLNKIYLPPTIDAFVGSDAVSSLFWALSQKKQETQDNIQVLKTNTSFLVVDIGTNGEIILCNDNSIIATSCAAGPAFEGQNLSRKITGSMAIKYLSQMLKENTIDKTGMITTSLSTPLNQEDIRQLQLAKAAIRAGIETLFQQEKIDKNKIESCYLCGNFGNALQEEEILAVDLLPKEFCGKIKYLGNAAGFGAVNLLFSEKNKEMIKKLAQKAKTMELGGNPIFNENYIKYINF